MDRHYFTFGKAPEQVQVIVASCANEAFKKMFELHGNAWGFQYTEEEWQQAQKEGYFKGAEYLSEVEVI